jgi:hypothetical protein
MISLWALVTESQIEAYCSSLVLPDYLSHLGLKPFRFADQPDNCNGREPLTVVYTGDGRLEEYRLDPEQHLLPLIQFVCPGIDPSRLQLPKDDASWRWTTSEGPPESMRIFFEPTTRVLVEVEAGPAAESSYVSVSRGHVFIDRATVESFIRACLLQLGAEPKDAGFNFATPSGAIDFSAGPLAGQMLLDGDVAAKDLIRFAGLTPALTHVANLNQPAANDSDEKCGAYEDGVYFRLSETIE